MTKQEALVLVKYNGVTESNKEEVIKALETEENTTVEKVDEDWQSSAVCW